MNTNMMMYILIGILICGLIALVISLTNEKRRARESEVNFTKKIDDLIDNIDVQSRNVDNLNSELENAINVSNTKLIDAIAERNSKITELQTNQNERILEISKEFSAQISNNISAIHEEYNHKITLLTTALEHVIAENADLKKKLEFFTEIGEDSTQLNEFEDEEATDKLIKQALAELKAVPDVKTSENTSGGNGKTIVETKTSTIEAKDSSVENTDEQPSPISDVTPSVLDKEQSVAFNIMNGTRDNLFITGKAGTGKSFLLKLFVDGTAKKTIKLAPTGIAALNIGGATLHSTFGYANLEQLSLEEINSANIRLKSEKLLILKEVDTIIIDEISMVRADTFDKIDKILRVINKSAKPFGGKQMIVFGDLFQLPPIAKRQEEEYLTDYYGGIFFFNSNSYSNGQFNYIELSTNHRQKDDHAFFEILNRMREGKTNNYDVETLNSRYIANRDELRRILTLYPKKADAEKLNKMELEKIPAKEYSYTAKILYNAKNNQTPNLDAIFPITGKLRLRRGALVMLVANDPNKRWVNGTMGVVHTLKENSISVSINNTVYDIEKTTFTEKEAIYKNGQIEYQDVLSVEQFPIVLAYAITIHKSQGMTYKNIACDISQCFAPGQAYVALSRCSSINGLHLLKPVSQTMMNVADNVLEFYLSQSTEKTIEKFS